MRNVGRGAAVIIDPSSGDILAMVSVPSYNPNDFIFRISQKKWDQYTELNIKSNRDKVRPLVISHGQNTRRPGHSALQDDFDWPGTHDPTAFLCVPTAIRHLESLVEGGFREIRRRNRDLALRGRAILTEALGIDAPCPDEMIGSLVALPVPDGAAEPNAPGAPIDPLQDALFNDYNIEVPVMYWPAPPRRLLRISTQLYNNEGQYRRLAAALKRELT